MAPNSPPESTSAPVAPPTEPRIVVDLKDPVVAGILAWLWPGLGHLYQRRTAKGILFMACILGVYFFGLAIAEGKVVYAKWDEKVERRWQYGFQLAVGLPATPALAQAIRSKSDSPPLWGGFMAAPRDATELSQLHNRLNIRFEIGTLYCVVAGLLNILAIYDATCGPAASEAVDSPRPPPDDKNPKPKK